MCIVSVKLPRVLPRGETTPDYNIITWCHHFFSTATNILLIKSNFKFESRATTVSVAISPRHLGGKYRSRLHPRSRKCMPVSVFCCDQAALWMAQSVCLSVKVKVTELRKSSILTQIGRFRTVTPVWIYQWLWNDAQSSKYHRRGALLFFKVICQISRSRGSKDRRIWPRLGFSGLYVQFEITDGYEIMHKAWSSIEEMPYFFKDHPSNFKVTRL